MQPFPEYLPALITPFTSSGEIDLEAHTHNLRVLSDQRIEGFLIGGSTGEGPYLEPGERARLVRAGRRRSTHLMVGIAAESTRTALSLVAEASEAGADSLLVLTPTTLSRGRDDAVIRYFTAVADAATIPVLLYSVPSFTAYSLPVELVTRLSRHDNIVGMKDSSGDVVRLQSIVDATPDGFLLYNGSSRALAAAITIGASGAITASGNYAADLVREVITTARRSTTQARELQKRLSDLAGGVESQGVAGIKAAAGAAGLKPGYPRAPLSRLPRGTETTIARLIS